MSRILIPKRKGQGLTKVAGEGVGTIISQIANSTGVFDDTIDKLHVVKRLRIPVGTDMYDVSGTTINMYEYYYGGTDTGVAIYHDNWAAQSFTPLTSHRITTVKLKLLRVSGTTGELIVRIQPTDIDGKPNGTTLCSGFILAETISDAPDNWAWYSIVLTAGYNLTATTKYAIVCGLPSADNSGTVYVLWDEEQPAPSYTRGETLIGDAAIPSWTAEEADFYFEEYGVGNNAGYLWVEGTSTHHTDSTNIERINLNTDDVDDTPVDAAITAPVSSNWAYDHVAAADPHTGYRLESADHTHQTTGMQAGQLDHGLSMVAASLLDDDHTQYRLESADHSHATTGIQAGQLDHGLAMETTSLTDNDHTQYVLHTEVDDVPVDGVTTDPISSNWAYDYAALTTSAIGALDYGLSFQAIVTTYTDTTHFKASGLIGKGDNFFKGYYAYVVRDAGGAGAAPQGEAVAISDFTSVDGTVTHTAFTTPVEVTDELILIHPYLWYLLELKAANVPADIDTLLTRLPGVLSAARIGYLDNINQAGLLQLTAARAALLDQITAARLAELDAANLPADVDTLKTNADPRVMGKSQIKATTIDLNQAAGTYDLFTGTTQVVLVEKLVIRMSGGAIGGALTSISIQTNDATPIVLIDAVAGAVANLTNEAQLAWTGAAYLKVGQKIRLTIAGGAAGAARVCDVVAECRAVVAGGLLT